MVSQRDKVIFILPSIVGGGVEKNTLRLIDQLKSYFDIELVLLHGKCEEIPGVSVRCLEVSRASQAIFPLSKLIKKIKPIAVVSAKDYINFMCLIAKIVSFRRVKLIGSIRADIYSIRLDSKNIIDSLNPILAAVLYPFFDTVITVSKDMETSVKNLMLFRKNRVMTIYNPIVDDSLVEQAKIVTHDLEAVFKKRAVRLLAVGRLEAQKDYDLMLDAISIVKESVDVNLAIVGEGSHRTLIENRIKTQKMEEYIKLLGHINNPYYLINNSQIVVLSSLYEGLPTVLVEALALGIPVVAVDCPTGPRELITSREVGRLVEARSPEALASAILDAINSEFNQANLVNRVSEFRADQTALKYRELIYSTTYDE